MLKSDQVSPLCSRGWSARLTLRKGVLKRRLNEEARYVDTWEKNIPGTGTSKCKDPKGKLYGSLCPKEVSVVIAE